MKKVPSNIVKQRSCELTTVFESFTPYVGMEGTYSLEMSSGNRRRSTSQRDVPSSSRATANPNMDMDDYLHPGPIDPSLLTMQSVHRTEAIWRNQMDNEFKSDKALRVMGHNVVNMNPRLTEYVATAGFLPWTQVCNVKIDPKLCTALEERWRPETHTFHLNGGEATITLQDVALLTGLPIDGEPVSGLGEFEWEAVCMSLLGAVPDRPKVKSMGSKTWFDNHLNNIPADVDEETLKKYDRAYILCLLGLTLMSDLYGDQVALHYLPLLADLDNAKRYSWGSAVLGYQYSQLCRASHWKKSQIGGCGLLLQFWYWERMRIGAPQPYLRDPPELEDDIHPWERLIYGDPGEDGEDIDIPSDEYVHWYSRITRRRIQPKLEEEETPTYRPSAHELPSNIRTLLICASQAAEGFTSTADSRPIFHRIFHTAVEELRVLGELRLLNINPDIIQFGNGDDDDMSVDDDHVTHLGSQPTGYDRPSSSRAPPSQPSRPSSSRTPLSSPGHGHDLRPEKTPKQSWLQKLRHRRPRKD